MQAVLKGPETPQRQLFNTGVLRYGAAITAFQKHPGYSAGGEAGLRGVVHM